MKITENFFLTEFVQRAGHGCPATPYPAEWVESRLKPLCQTLEVLRKELGGYPMKVISGYRSPEYNRAVKGAPQSQHMEGRAADIQVKGVRAAEVQARAYALYQAGILKIGGLGIYETFTHLDIRTGPFWRG